MLANRVFTCFFWHWYKLCSNLQCCNG